MAAEAEEGNESARSAADDRRESTVQPAQNRRRRIPRIDSIFCKDNKGTAADKEFLQADSVSRDLCITINKMDLIPAVQYGRPEFS